MTNHTNYQGGILSGHEPTEYNPSNPLVLFIIQATIIICATRGLNFIASHFRQPRVISEVLGGIILGPSVLGRIPHFNETIFPTSSLPFLNLAASLGLVLYLFLVGLELDLRLLTRNAKVALSISAAGMIIPFALGSAVGYGLYHLNDLPDVTFPNFLLFLGVAMSITAFPVLARIVTELKLIRTKVGVTALCAAVGDDVTAWVLLALVVSILNSSSTITALYVFLLAIAWTLILFFIIRPILLRIIVATGSDVNGPTVTMMSLTLLLVLISALITDAIGVHAIFGGFMVGVIIPHDGGFALGVNEKLEDLVHIVFLPLYFALSGLNTSIDLLNDGTAWGYVFLVIFLAMLGKISGATLVARICKMTWRESLTVGVFMSCKGLVELIVLNIGLSAGVISPKIFVILVVMAIVTTCLTTPLVTYLYPPKYHSSPGGENIENGGKLTIETIDSRRSEDTLREKTKPNKILVVLNNIEYLPAMMTLIQLLRPLRTFTKPSAINLSEKKEKSSKSPQTIADNMPILSQDLITVNALRLVELTDRMTTIMKGHETEETVLHDPIMNVFRAFGRMHFVNVRANLSVVRFDEFPGRVAQSAKETTSELVIIPWSGAGAITEDPFNSHDIIVGSRENKNTGPHTASFVQNVFSEVPTNVGVFVDRGLGVVPGGFSLEQDSSLTIKVFFPFFGGVDDREALIFVTRLIEHPYVTATILRIKKSTEPTVNDTSLIVTDSNFDSNNTGNQDEITSDALPTRPSLTHQISSATIPIVDNNKVDRGISEEADQNLITSFFGVGRGTLISNSRITYKEIVSATPMQTAIQRAKEVVSRKDLVIVGRGRANAAISHREEWVEVIKNIGMMGYSHDNLTRKTLGLLAEGLLIGGVPASVLVIQGKKN
ncbi:3449_t:CDS:2 [Ambispora leptoticha]|uniref:3449_t:CDS:1 n=1 Tax=Ambispora leptoticha TaxID=144679 RepID=A0A9N8VAY0_9GLOM|nr:3449_t:CDS:2 [Ambispora leptoticha]